MKRVILLALAAALVAAPAAALNLTSVPTKFPIPWANSASAPYVRTIPVPSQIGVQNCAASLTDGFPPLTFQPVGSGGCQPFGQDYNGIFRQVTQWLQWAGAGATVLWDTSYQTSISGYPRGALLSQSANVGCYWVNTLDANTTNPDAAGAGWTSACPGGGIGTAVTGGSANAQTLAATPFALNPGTVVYFQAGFTNTAATTLNTNSTGAKAVTRQTPGGLAALTGGEVQLNQWQLALYDGTQYELLNSPATAYLTAADQNLSGGANVTSLGLATGSVTIDCGARPLQWIANTGAWTLNAPVNDGSCMLQIENGAGAAVPATSGFTFNASNIGDPFTTTNGSKFVLSIWRVHGVSSFIVKALQ
jgi:hypothetical protein